MIVFHPNDQQHTCVRIDLDVLEVGGMLVAGRRGFVTYIGTLQVWRHSLKLAGWLAAYAYAY